MVTRNEIIAAHLSFRVSCLIDMKVSFVIATMAATRNVLMTCAPLRVSHFNGITGRQAPLGRSTGNLI
jgi:hypothetical protein